MKDIKCYKCNGNLENQNKKVTTVDHDDNYKMKQVNTYKCIKCGYKYYIR